MSSLCKVQNQPEMQYSLLSVLGNRDQNDVSRTLLGMSTSPDTCAAMRSSGCLPLIIRLLYAPDSSQDMKKHVALALNNIVNSNQDEAQSKLEGRVLNLLENVRHYCDSLVHQSNGCKENQDKNIGMTVATILRLSFDGDQRRAMSVLGGIHSIAYLIQVLHDVYGGTEDTIHCLMLKRYASMALTNLTFGHNSNKVFLCSLKLCMHALVAQLNSPSEELQQATASVIRNLSWKADGVCKQILRETGAISTLMKVAMKVKKESTLQSMLSALWNLSSNCSLNKIELCAVEGALGFLTLTLTYKSPSQKLCVIEYAGGVLRNISSHVAEREDYRAILREYDCLQVLTQHLTSPSTRVVGNACITLWNLSFECPEDQYTLWMLGAPNLLRNLVHSKHKLIALGSSAALKNLLSGRPEADNLYSLLIGVPSGSSLAVGSSVETSHRGSKTVEEELDEVLSESRFKKEGHVTVTGRRDDKFVFSVTDVEKKRQQRRSYHRSHSLSRSGSKEFVSSALQENGHDGLTRSNGTGDRKHSSSVDLSANEDSSGAATSEEKSTKLIGKFACLFIKDDTEGDLSFDNEAISTVDELLGVVKDMASLRLNEDSSCKNGEIQNEECKVKSEETVKVDPETDDSKSGLQTTEGTENSELKSNDASLVKDQREELVTSDFCSSDVQKLKASEEQLGEDRFVTGEERPVKLEPVVPPEELPDKTCDESHELKTEPLAPDEELQRSLEEMPAESINECSSLKNSEFLELTSPEEIPPSLEQTLSDDLVSTEDYSAPKNVSLMSPRSLEGLSSDELTNESSSLVKKEPVSSPEDLQRSLEELPSDELASEVKKELATPVELARSLEELTFEEDIEEGSTETYDIDFAVGDSDEKPRKRVQFERSSSQEEYGDYAETDLDQPTDYSLQYGEEDELTDDDEIQQSNKRDPTFYVSGVPISIHEDTVKTYCTEGTPFETPYNFSTATSMSDLRTEPSIKEEMDERETASVGQKEVAAAALNGGSPQAQEKLVDDALLLDRIHSMDTGLLSPPEKPVQFCEEGTPGQCISRFSSLSSLCGDVNQVDRPRQNDSKSRGNYFNGDNEVPPHSNGVGETFSAARKSDEESDNVQPKTVRLSVFEDAMVSFKDETTPINFSCATSLSSLSFDDEPKIPMDTSLKRGTPPQKGSADLIPQSQLATEEYHTDPSLPLSPRFSFHLQRRKEVFPSQTTVQSACNLKQVSPGVRSPRLPAKQENGSHLSTSVRSNGEDVDGYEEEDTTYRFCTEGTPANISHAGSHSDLSVLSIPHLRGGKMSGKIDESSDDNLSFTDDCENILAECIMSGMPKMAEAKRSNGLQNKSLSVENGHGSNEGFVPKEEDEERECEQADNAKQRDEIGDKGKVVTFDNADHYAEETPLMFSRASSLASLSSFDQQSIVDDRSSIISDFSRLTSGAVSPSEIPDSSSQLISASPHRSKAPSVSEAADLGRTSKQNFSDMPQPASHQTFNTMSLGVNTQICVFEDDVKPFKVEDTPVHFSRATSLSSLSIFDDAIPADDAAVCLPKKEDEDSKDAPKEDDKDKTDDTSDKSSILLESEGEEDDDAILAACISIGMQQSRKPQDSNPPFYNNLKSRNNFSPPASPSNFDPNHSNNPVNHQVNHPELSPVKRRDSRSPKPSQQVSTVSRCSEPVPDNGACDDVTHGYFTEDTPAISHAVSHSDLSVLSFRSGKDAEDSGRTRTTTELSDDVFNISDNEGMLAECIQAGMPKKSTTKKRNNSLTTYPEREVNGNFSLRHQLRDDRNENSSPRHPLGNDRNENLSPRHQLKDDRIENLSPRHQLRDDRNGIENFSSRHQPREERNGIEHFSPRHLFRDDRNGIESLPPRHQLRDDRNENLSPRHHFREERNGVENLPPRHQLRDDRNENLSPRHQLRDDRNGIEYSNDRPKSNASSLQLSPVLHKSKPTSRPVSANSHVSSFMTKSSHSRKSRRALPAAEPRRIEGADAFEDSMYRFNTEDTPASISHAGSNSDISILSIPDDDKEFQLDFHKHNRQHSFHYHSDDSLDNADNDILAECIQSGMPRAKSASRPINKPSHSGGSSSYNLHHHSLDPTLNSPRRSSNQVPVQPRHGSRSTARTSKNAGFTRRSLSQSDRPQNYPINVIHGHMMSQQSLGNDAILNRNDAILNRNDALFNRNIPATGTWSNAPTHKLSFNRENARTPPSYPNNNASSYDSGWEMDASILKDSQALRSMLQNHQNPRWLRKFGSTSPNHRRYSESQSSCSTFYSRENSSSLLQSNGDLSTASVKVPCGQSSQQPLSLPSNMRPLDRQRTFTKLEPSSHTHLTSPPSKTKIPIPAQAPTKGPEKMTSNSKKMAAAEQTLAKGRFKSKTVTNSQPKKIDQDKVSDRSKVSKSSSGYTSAASKASCSWSGKSTPTSTLRSHGPSTPSTSSTTSLVFKQNTTERRSFRVSRPTGLEDKRSNSFSSITSSASSKSSVRPLKREVASKVASLWKRTDTSSDDGQGKSNARNDGKNSDSEKRAVVARKIVRSATFEGLPRNLELAKTDKIKDDSQLRSSNHVDRSKKTSNKSRFLSEKKEQQMNKVKSQAEYKKSSENGDNSREDPCTSVINRHDRAKSSSKSDQNSVRVTKV